VRTALCLVVLAIAAAGCGGGEDVRLLPPERALAASRSLTPTLHLFGDPVVARVELVVDRRLLDPRLLRVTTDFRPYERVGPVRLTRRDDGPYTRLRYEHTLRCLTGACVPERLASAAGAAETGRGERRTYTFRPAQILYEERSGSPERLLDLSWPALVSVSRINEVQAGASFPFRGSATPLPALTQRLPPLLLVGVLLVVGLGLLVWPTTLVLRWWRGRHPPVVEEHVAAHSPLEHALLLVEWSCGQPNGSERREALERLATVLAETDTHGFVEQSRQLAWSRGSPSAEEAADLVRSVRRSDGAAA
jgi:hypothetical protein